MFIKKFLALVIIVICLFLLSCDSPKIVERKVNEFELNEIGFIDETLEEFAPEVFLGEKKYIENFDKPQDAAQNIEIIWFEIYGEEQIIEQRPYIICLNEDESLWYIYGNDDFLEDCAGGVVNAIISKEDGEVLAIWHGE